MPRFVVERIPKVEPIILCLLSADIEARGRIGDCPRCAAKASHGRATKRDNNEGREGIRRTIHRTLIGKAVMNAHKDRVADAQRVKEKEFEWNEVQGDVFVEPRNDEQMSDRHAVASGEDERQHDENILRDFHIGERGSETAYEEQRDKLSKTVRFEQQAPKFSVIFDLACVSCISCEWCET